MTIRHTLYQGLVFACAMQLAQAQTNFKIEQPPGSNETDLKFKLLCRQSTVRSHPPTTSGFLGYPYNKQYLSVTASLEGKTWRATFSPTTGVGSYSFEYQGSFSSPPFYVPPTTSESRHDIRKSFTLSTALSPHTSLIESHWSEESFRRWHGSWYTGNDTYSASKGGSGTHFFNDDSSPYRYSNWTAYLDETSTELRRNEDSNVQNKTVIEKTIQESILLGSPLLSSHETYLKTVNGTVVNEENVTRQKASFLSLGNYLGNCRDPFKYLPFYNETIRSDVFVEYTDSQGSIVGSVTLAGEYTTEQCSLNTENSLLEYSDSIVPLRDFLDYNWNDQWDPDSEPSRLWGEQRLDTHIHTVVLSQGELLWGYVGQWLFDPWFGETIVGNEEIFLGQRFAANWGGVAFKTNYWWECNDGPASSITWIERFEPWIDPENAPNPLPTPRYVFRHWVGGGGVTRSPDYEVRSAHDLVDGLYYIDLLPVEILDKDKKVVNKLKVAKMVETGVLSGSGASATLNPNNDSDRFYIRIPGGASFGTGSVKIGTVDNPDASYNDDETEVDFEVEGSDLITKSMLLVSDNVDDDHKVDGVDDDVKNDRTHKIQLGGNLQIKSLKLSGTEHATDIKTPAPFEKTVKVKFYNCTSGVFSKTPVFTQAQLNSQVARIKERFAQCGLKADVTTAVGADLGWTSGIDPMGVYWVNGTTHYITIPSDCRNLFTNASMPVAADEIGVYAVGYMTGAGGDRGQTSVPKYMYAADKAAGYGNKCIIAADYANPQTSAHELMHVLLNAEHPDYGVEFSNSIMLWYPSVWNANIMDTKRISVQQAADIVGKSGNPAKSTFPQ